MPGDFRSGERIDVARFFEESVDIHHIFPKAWCLSHSISRERMESFVNKTALSARTNRIISGSAPSDYLERLQSRAKMTEARMDEILDSHVIDPIALRLDEFDAFFEKRSEELLARIEQAMGKPIIRNVDDGGDILDDDELAA